MRLSLCGYRCDLCQAFCENIAKNDRREGQSAAFHKYYGLDIPPEQCVCDGCRCERADARRLDDDCPVRACAMEKKVDHCGVCGEYPCARFETREGLSRQSARAVAGNAYDDKEYDEYLLAFDNKTRLDELKEQSAS